MRVVTEADLRAQCRERGETVVIDSGDYLTESAVRYIEEKGLRLVREAEAGVPEDCKPEHMTHLSGDILVPKTSARIRYRGMLDYAQAKTVETQVLAEKCGFSAVSDDLQELLLLLRKLMAHDVTDAPVGALRLLGLDEKQLREMSHHPEKHICAPHTLPDRSQGGLCAAVNVLRTVVRQAELAAIDAYGAERAHEGAVMALNRLSSAVYIVYCRLLAGYYKAEEG